uniref:WH2 domain-containing protein n=1 Tax=Heterorhabditis bacteriophora TaxID=37862 RepID=A0A1I7XNC7_HETBA
MQERLTTLRRHKEKLEEKIMDQYRSMESKRSTDRSKQPLVKRAAKALISRRRPAAPSSGGGSTTEDSSVYSADEGSPPFSNGKLRPSISAPIATDSQCSVHDKSVSLRIPSLKKRPPVFRDDLFQGAYTNPNVDKMIDMQGSICENGRVDFDPFPPTCSSSEDPDRISPRYEAIETFHDAHTAESGFLRPRGVQIGGSVREVGGFRRLPQFTYTNTERLRDGTQNALPPRVPVRNSNLTGSLRTRPPPPPYPSISSKPPPYPGKTPTTSSPCPTSSQFLPQSASTPKSEKGSPNKDADRPVVAEGEKRAFVREKDERVDKAMSIYENVSNSDTRSNESTVWYEYGCV